MATTTKNAGKGAKKGEQNPLFVVAYVLAWLTGIVVFIIAKPSDKRLRFNALQAVFLGIVITVLGFIPFVGGPIAFVLWIIGIIAGAKAYNGDDVYLPIIGEYAKKYS